MFKILGHLRNTQDSFQPLVAIQNNCCLLSHLLMTLVAQVANNMEPDQTALEGTV